MAWGILVAAALLECVWAISLKYADGFTRLWPSVIGIAAAIASFALLTVALKDLPVGTAYAIWVGIGAFTVAVAGIFAFDESSSLIRLGFLALILVGVVGLRIVEA